MEISGKTRLLALFGRPVEHSLSPAMHNASFESLGLDFVYVALNVEPGDVPAAVRGAVAMGFGGFNATMPHKRAMVPLMDELDEASRISGAVNTVVVEGARLLGHNTDGSGLIEACREAGVGLAGRGVLLLGAGGAAASVAVALCDAGAGSIRIVNRNADKARELAAKLQAAGKGTQISTGPLERLDEMADGAEVVVNTTPLGMKDGDPLPVPERCLEGGRVIVDAVYRPGVETPLILAARDRGAKTISGQRMLLYQGVQAQQLWTGRRPNVEAMDAMLK